MGETHSTLSIKYRISLEDYTKFYKLSVEGTFKKPRKSAFMLGTIEIVAGVLLLIYLLTSGKYDNFILFVDFFIIAMGIYSFTFYKLVLPVLVKKSAIKQYVQRKYVDRFIKLDFYDDKFAETSNDIASEVLWKDIYCFKSLKSIFLIMLSEKQSVIIPKSEVKDNINALEKIFKKAAKEYGKKYYYEK